MGDFSKIVAQEKSPAMQNTAGDLKTQTTGKSARSDDDLEVSLETHADAIPVVVPASKVGVGVGVVVGNCACQSLGEA